MLKGLSQIPMAARERKPILIDFDGVKFMTPDVLPLLCAKISKYNPFVSIWGTRPKDSTIDLMLRESGFYNLVGLEKATTDNSMLVTHQNTKVDNYLAKSIRQFTAERTFGDKDLKLRPLYRTMIECMANTGAHAAADKNPKENWWLSVYYDNNTGISSFAFCDTGVGIFKSTKLKSIYTFSRVLGIIKNSSILQKILDGKITSSTGLAYRGKGLPKIYSDYQANSIKNLHIAANDTFAGFDSGTFIDLKDELNGTFLYWEIHPK